MGDTARIPEASMAAGPPGPPEFPPTVFVPSRRGSAGDAELRLELRTLADGRTAMLAYTSLASLVAGCGAAQPWVSIRAERLVELREHFDLVLVDVALPDDLRVPAGEPGAGPSGEPSEGRANRSNEPG